MNITLADDADEGHHEGDAPHGSTPLEAAQGAKAAGLAAAKASNWPRAAASFRQAASILQAAYSYSDARSPAELAEAGGAAEAHALRLDCLNNRAQVLIMAERWPDAEAAATEVLAIDATNLKARFRRCRARLQLSEEKWLAAAVEDFCILRNAEPHNPKVNTCASWKKQYNFSGTEKEPIVIEFKIILACCGDQTRSVTFRWSECDLLNAC